MSNPSLLKSFHVSMIAVGGIIGAGLFVGTSATIAQAGPAVLVSYGIAGFFIWLVMKILGDLALDMGHDGSFITSIYHHLGAYFAFITGWGYAFLWAVTAGAQAVAGGYIIDQLFGIPSLFGAIFFVAVAWVINRLSLRFYGEVEAGLSLLKVLFIGLFILVGGLLLVFYGHSLSSIRHNLEDFGGFAPKGYWAILASIPMIMQCFSGCEIAVLAAHDSEEPRKNIAQLVTRIPLQILFFYGGSVAVIVMSVPWSSLKIGTSPFLTLLETRHLPFAPSLAIGVTLIAVLSCLNSSVYVVSRIVKELASLSLAPIFLTYETKKHVPLWSLRLTTFLELCIIAVAISSPAVMYPILLGASGGIIIFVYFMISWAVMRKARLEKVKNKIACIMTALLLVLFIALFFLPQTRFDHFLSFLVLVLFSIFYGIYVFFIRFVKNKDRFVK